MRATVAIAMLVLVAVGCSDGAEHVTLPELSFARSDGAQPLLVLRHVAAWCGPCQWHAQHTAELIPAELRGRVRVIDVLLANQDNAAPDARALEAWSELTGDAAVSVADPNFALARYFPQRVQLPLIALVGARDRSLLQTLSAPDPAVFAQALRQGLAELDGEAAAAAPRAERFDGRFTRDQWEMIRAMRLPLTAADDPSNIYASDPRAAELGRQLFSDAELSPSPKRVSCSTCHDAKLHFQDGRDRPAEGVGLGVRNVPSLLLATDQRWQLWDGRADSAWAQATMPFEDPTEIASSRSYIAHVLARKYAEAYSSIFGPLPALDDVARFPAAGGPGDASWQAMTPDDRSAVSRVLANVGKAIAAYERSLRPEPNALDRYADGDTDALSDDEKNGLVAFFSAGCAQCHYGPRLTDDAFHNLRFPTGLLDRSPDPGREAGLERLARGDFTRASSFSDAATPLPAAGDSARLGGAFKTPGLRGVAYTVPYGHAGSFGGLTGVLEAHADAGLPAGSPYTTGTADLALAKFDRALTPSLVSFLRALRLDLPE